MDEEPVGLCDALSIPGYSTFHVQGQEIDNHAKEMHILLHWLQMRKDCRFMSRASTEKGKIKWSQM